MRKVASVLIVAALFASTAAMSVKHQRQWTEKLDAGLAEAAKTGGNDLVRTLIRVRPDARSGFMSHLEQHGLTPEPSSTPDLVAVQLPVSMLRTIAGDSEVVHISPDPHHSAQ